MANDGIQGHSVINGNAPEFRHFWGKGCWKYLRNGGIDERKQPMGQERDGDSELRV
jgi:hypothetical protein